MRTSLTEAQMYKLQELGIEKESCNCYFDVIEDYTSMYYDITPKDDKHYSSYKVRCKKKGLQPKAKKSQVIQWLQEELKHSYEPEIITIVTGTTKTNLKTAIIYDRERNSLLQISTLDL